MPNSSLESRAEERVTLPSLKEKWGGFSYPANPIEAVIPDVRNCEIRFGFTPAERASLAQEVLRSRPRELNQIFEKGITPQAVNRAFEAISLGVRNGVFTPVIYESEQIQTPYATIGYVFEPLQFSLLRRSPNRDEKLLDRILQAAQTSISRHSHLTGIKSAFNNRELADGTNWSGVKAIFDPVTGRMLNVGQVDSFIQTAAESWHRARYVALLIAQGQTYLAEKIWQKQTLRPQKINLGIDKHKQSLTFVTIQGEPTNVWVMPSNSWLAEQIESNRQALSEGNNPSHKNLKLGVVAAGGALITMSALLSACDSGYIPPPLPTEVSLPQPLTEKVAKDVLGVWGGKQVEYGQNLTLAIDSAEFEVDPTLAYPSDNNNGYVEDIQYRLASNKVTVIRGGTETEKSYQWLVVSDPTGVRSFILKELSPDDDKRVGVNNTTVYALAELKNGKAGETGEKLVVQGKATEQEPSLTLETKAGIKVLVEIRPNGNGVKPTPTSPVDIIEDLLAAAAGEAQAAEPEPTEIPTEIKPTPPAPPETEEAIQPTKETQVDTTPNPLDTPSKEPDFVIPNQHRDFLHPDILLKGHFREGDGFHEALFKPFITAFKETPWIDPDGREASMHYIETTYQDLEGNNQKVLVLLGVEYSKEKGYFVPVVIDQYTENGKYIYLNRWNLAYDPNVSTYYYNPTLEDIKSYLKIGDQITVLFFVKLPENIPQECNFECSVGTNLVSPYSPKQMEEFYMTGKPPDSSFIVPTTQIKSSSLPNSK